MNCPVDGAELRMMEREGVEIDYCPKCRGVWLDRGELDKILDRAGEPRGYAGSGDRYEGESPQRRSDRGSTEDRGRPQREERHERESIWSRLFDFD